MHLSLHFLKNQAIRRMDVSGQPHTFPPSPQGTTATIHRTGGWVYLRGGLYAVQTAKNFVFSPEMGLRFLRRPVTSNVRWQGGIMMLLPMFVASSYLFCIGHRCHVQYSLRKDPVMYAVWPVIARSDEIGLHNFSSLRNEATRVLAVLMNTFAAPSSFLIEFPRNHGELSCFTNFSLLVSHTYVLNA